MSCFYSRYRSGKGIGTNVITRLLVMYESEARVTL